MRNNSLYKFVITSIILILALSVSGWGECIDASNESWNKSSNCNYKYDKCNEYTCYVDAIGSCNPQACTKGRAVSISRRSNYNPTGKTYVMGGDCQLLGDWSYVKVSILYSCDTRSEADSMLCVLNPSDPSCCDAHCECDKAGGTWHPNGYCVKNCQTEACCDSLNVPQVAYDSVYIWQNNSCALHWRCESYQAECVAINGLLVADVLPDTTTQDGTTAITNKCYYNCGRIIPSDSSKSMVDGNIVLPSSAALISQGIKTPNPFDAIRSEDNGEYTYDFLSPQAGHYLDSIAFTPCVQVLYRCVLNGKYAYYYDNQTAPSGCTNIVKIK